MYFTGKVKDYNNNVDYWEGSSMSIKMGKCVFDNYFDALIMKIDCLINKGRLYTVGKYCA